MSDPARATRVTVRIEYADGLVREFTSENPAQFDLRLTHPDKMPGMVPGVFLDAAEPFRPALLEFSVRPDGAYPMTMQTYRQPLPS